MTTVDLSAARIRIEENFAKFDALAWPKSDDSSVNHQALRDLKKEAKVLVELIDEDLHDSPLVAEYLNRVEEAEAKLSQLDTQYSKAISNDINAQTLDKIDQLDLHPQRYIYSRSDMNPERHIYSRSEIMAQEIEEVHKQRSCRCQIL